MAKYRLTLTEEQLIEVKDALELRFRIDLLQEDMLAEILASLNNLDLSHDNPDHERIFDRYLDRRAHIREVLKATFEIACPYVERVSGGRSRDIHSLRCEDVWSVVRHQIWLDNPNRQQWDVDSREALKCSDLELPTIERIDNG